MALHWSSATAMGRRVVPARVRHGAVLCVARWGGVFAELLEKMGHEERQRGVTPNDNVVALMAAMAGPSYPSADAALFLQVRVTASSSLSNLSPPCAARACRNRSFVVRRTRVSPHPLICTRGYGH